LCKKKTEIKLITADEIAKCKTEEKNVILQWLSKEKRVALRKYNLLLNIKTPPSGGILILKVSN
jgi:hypothetical protein